MTWLELQQSDEFEGGIRLPAVVLASPSLDNTKKQQKAKLNDRVGHTNSKAGVLHCDAGVVRPPRIINLITADAYTQSPLAGSASDEVMTILDGEAGHSYPIMLCC